MVLIPTVMLSPIGCCLLEATIPETCQEASMWCLLILSCGREWGVCIGSQVTRNMPRSCHVVSIHTVMWLRMGFCASLFVLMRLCASLCVIVRLCES